MKKNWVFGVGLTLALACGLNGCGESTSLLAPASAQVQGDVPVPEPSSQDPAVVLPRLKAGNARYVAGTNQLLVRSNDRPVVLNSKQAPAAVILSCADSRVAPELAFDQGWGDLFVVRVAGPVSETYGIGSIEFAIGALGVRQIVVLGHEQCGAVNAALGDTLPPGNLGELVKLIVPAAQSVLGQPGDPLENATKANIALQIAQLRAQSSVIDQAVRAVGPDHVEIVGALYHFDTGEIEFNP